MRSTSQPRILGIPCKTKTTTTSRGGITTCISCKDSKSRIGGQRRTTITRLGCSIGSITCKFKHHKSTKGRDLYLQKTNPTRWFPSHSSSPQHNQQEVRLQTMEPITNQEGRPSFSIGVYELGDRFGTYRSVGPFAETSRAQL